MATRDLSTEVGRLFVRARDDELAQAVLESALAAFLEGRSVGLAVELSGRPGWLKGGPPRGSAGLRYGLRWCLARRAPPRGREYANLSWLEARLFRVPSPLATGWIVRRARLRFQFLVTALSEDARPLELATTALAVLLLAGLAGAIWFSRRRRQDPADLMPLVYERSEIQR